MELVFTATLLMIAASDASAQKSAPGGPVAGEKVFSSCKAWAAYLLQDGFGGRPEVRGPPVEALLPCCPPTELFDA